MVSVCICTYNGEKFIEEQLECIRKQTAEADEVIVCDDASVDGTVAIVEGYIEKYHLREKWKLLANTENKGYPANFYYAMGLCSGDIVFLADQDDIWELNKIAKMQKVLEDRPEIKVLSCCLGIVDESGQELKGLLAPKKINTGAVHPVSVQEVLYKDCWAGMSLAYRKEFWNEIRGQVESGSLPHDRALWTLAADKEGFYQQDDTLVYHRRHSTNTCKEEHRVRKLMRYERKAEEIRVYIGYLQGFLDEKIVLSRTTEDMIRAKKERMEVRSDNLENRRAFGILKDYIRHRGEIRITTMLCDLGIVLLGR